MEAAGAEGEAEAGRTAEVHRLSAGYVSWYGGKRSQTLTTPLALFERLHAEYRFTLDGAASDRRLLPRISTADEPLPWFGERVFCNPPWSNIAPFVEMATTAAFACLLVPARCNCRWFHRALALGAQVRFFLGKPKFGDCKHTSPVDCLLLVFGGGA